MPMEPTGDAAGYEIALVALLQGHADLRHGGAK